MLRLFIALLPPTTVREELAGLAAPLAGVRWTPAENIHLTMRFIGEVAEARMEQFAQALTRVRVEPFILPVSGVGVFPSRGPAKVLWAGVGNGHTRLYQLRKQVDEALLTIDAALPMPGFHPHFTLGRMHDSHETKALSRFLDQNQSWEGPPFCVTEIHLMSSRLAPGQPPVYTALHSIPVA